MQEREDRNDRVIAERACQCDGALLVEQQDRQGEDLCPIQVGVVGLSGDGRGGQITERQRSVGGDDHAIQIDAAMHDSRGVQPVELIPQTRDGLLLEDGWCRIGDRRCDRVADRPDDEQRVTQTRTSRGDDVGDVGAGALGEQRDQCFVLDEVDLTVSNGALRSAIPEPAPHVGEQSGVAGITAVHLDQQRADVVAALVLHHALALDCRGGQVVHDDPEIAEREHDA